MLLLLAISCAPEDDVKLDSKPGDSDPGSTSPALSLSAPPAFDPIAQGAVSLDVTTDAAAVSVTITDAAGATVHSATGDTTWDGKVNGAWAPAGTYTVEVVASGAGGEATIEEPLSLVRVGVVAVYAEDDGGVTATRVPLFWSRTQDQQDVDVALVEVASLEDEAGVASVLSAVGTDLTGPSDGAPTAWPYDSRPILTFVPGDTTVLGSTGLDAVDVGVQLEGWSVVSGVPVLPGVPIVMQKDEALAAGPMVVEGDLTLTWTVSDADGEPIPFSTQAVPWRAYALFGVPSFDETGPQYTAWTAAVDPALRAIGGVAADHGAVLDALVEWIFTDSGLSYDTTSGASAYTAWIGSGWEDEEFNFSAFLIRRFGTIVNCTDCAHILLTYANMLGAELNYTIILQNFSLNYILAIGGTSFSNCPFGPGGCGFSYHAVTTNDGGETIWDATLALDGDDNPSATPSTELLVQSIPGEEYLDRLVMSGRASYNYETKGYLK